jgi:hypothetical protein
MLIWINPPPFLDLHFIMEMKSKSGKPRTGTKTGFTGNKKRINSIGNVSVTIGEWNDKTGISTHRTKN